MVLRELKEGRKGSAAQLEDIDRYNIIKYPSTVKRETSAHEFKLANRLDVSDVIVKQQVLKQANPILTVKQ